MMLRTQISLRPEAHRRARSRAAELGVSLAEYLRQLVDADLEQPSRSTDASGLFDLGRSAHSDISRHKDRYIGEAIEAEHPSRNG